MKKTSKLINSTINYYLQDYEADAVLISDLNNIQYLTGFTGTNGLVLVTKKQSYFFTDFRYWQQAAKQVSHKFLVKRVKHDLVEEIAKVLTKKKVATLGFEAHAVTFREYQLYKKRFAKLQRKVKLTPIVEASAALRMIKKNNEIKKIEKALKINQKTFRLVRQHIKPDKTERAIATLLERGMLKAGAEKIGFDTIVASGSRAALPHGIASGKKIKKGELITIDFGCSYRGYHSDETITFCLGKPTKKQKEVHQVVLDAQKSALELVKPGVAASALDAAARAYIAKKGFGKYFGHALGHGVGLEIHERPILSDASSDILEAGMVFTIEPGIYIPNWGGVRIEDVVVCTKTGARIISKIDKKLVSL